MQFPTLESLCFFLEAANSHPANALNHLKHLADQVDFICENLDMTDEYFTKKEGADEMEIVT